MQTEMKYSAAAVESTLNHRPGGPRFTAAHAEWLRRVWKCKLYRARADSWDEFCRSYVGLSGPRATRLIRHLEEFGPAYFELTALVRVLPEEFRAIAPMVKNRHLCIHGEAIALIPENAGILAAAIEKLRRPKPSPKRLDPSYSPPDARLALLDLRSKEITSEFRRLARETTPDLDRLQLAHKLRRTLSELGRIEMELGIF